MLSNEYICGMSTFKAPLNQVNLRWDETVTWLLWNGVVGKSPHCGQHSGFSLIKLQSDYKFKKIMFWPLVYMRKAMWGWKMQTFDNRSQNVTSLNAKKCCSLESKQSMPMTSFVVWSDVRGVMKAKILAFKSLFCSITVCLLTQEVIFLWIMWEVDKLRKI